MKHYYFLLIIIFLLGCKGEELCNSRLDQYPNIVTGYYLLSNPDSININFKLKYNSKGQIIRRIGGFYYDKNTYMPRSFFTDNVYDSIVYIGDTIKILNIYLQPNEYYVSRSLQEETTIVLSENGNFKESYKSDGQSMKYYYNKNNQISKTITTISVDTSVMFTWNRTFFYSASANLDSCRTIFTDANSTISSLSNFSNFDNVPNPFKSLRMFDDTFIRSLSENNYRKKYSSANNFAEWQFSYDECGNIKF